MLTVKLTEAEAQVVADVIVAWGADDCPVGAIDTQVLRTASDKLTAAIDGQVAKAALANRRKGMSMHVMIWPDQTAGVPVGVAPHFLLAGQVITR